jgi:nitrile hydratase
VNRVHDMGGMHGFGPVEPERHEPVFHHDWEKKVFALRFACGAIGKWNIDMARHANERMPPADYLAATYYERWLNGLERLLLERGVVTQRELDEGRSAGPLPAEDRARVLRPTAVEGVLAAGRNYRVDEAVAARFAPGAAVMTRNIQPRGATRLPRYARGRRGVVDRDHGVFIFPDANAAGLGPKPQHLYSVRFGARELWGEAAAPHDAVYLDLWDDYLEPVQSA